MMKARITRVFVNAKKESILVTQIFFEICSFIDLLRATVSLVVVGFANLFVDVDYRNVNKLQEL